MTTEPKSSSEPSMDPELAFVELSRIMLGNQPLSAVLQRIAELAKQVIPGVHDASVTLMEGDKARTVVFTSPLAVELDERQYQAGFGPCMDAAVTGQLVIVDNSASDSPYPDFSPIALRCGIQHVVSVGLPVPQRIVGGLNLYADTAGPIDEEAMQLALTFANYAAVAVANAALYSSTAELARQMQLAVKSRAVIDQAKGVLMAEHRYSSDDAFAALAQLSQQQNVKLRDVAQRIVDDVARQ